MAVYCHRTIRSLKEYMNMPGGSEVLVYDLKHQADQIYRQAKQQGLTIYSGFAKRKSDKKDWIQFFILGRKTPTVLHVELSNGVKLYEYSKFDNTNEDITEEEMQPIAEILDKSRIDGKIPLTGIKIIGSKLPEKIAAIPNMDLFPIEDEFYPDMCAALRGGANHIIKNYVIDNETHIDFHQIYAYVMSKNRFPRSVPKYFSGCASNLNMPFGLYVFSGGQAKLKSDGYALFKAYNKDKMAGADGEWFDLAKEIRCMCSVDWEIFKQNFICKDVYISDVLYYEKYFEGEEAFGPMIQEIYNNRKNSTGAAKRYYKLQGEYAAGYFEKTTNDSTWWKNMETPPSFQDCFKYNIDNCKNPIVGIFITAYARELLNNLLHMFPHDKVVGYDTDCVFFEGTPDEAEQIPGLKEAFGDEAGQLHYDGVYKNVLHQASKHYHGYDTDKRALVKKQSGVSKSGMVQYWDPENICWRTKYIEK